MNKKQRTILIVALVSVGSILLIGFYFLIPALATFGGSTNERANHDPLEQQDMLKCTLEWGRLAPIPDSKTDFKIRTEGSMFTREFISSFYLPKEDLLEWIKASPGLQGFAEQTEGKKEYNIVPGGGAQGAEAEIDFDTGLVKIDVYWS